MCVRVCARVPVCAAVAYWRKGSRFYARRRERHAHAASVLASQHLIHTFDGVISVVAGMPVTTVGPVLAGICTFVRMSQTIATATTARRATAPSPPPMIAPIGSSSLLGSMTASDPLVGVSAPDALLEAGGDGDGDMVLAVSPFEAHAPDSGGSTTSSVCKLVLETDAPVHVPVTEYSQPVMLESVGAMVAVKGTVAVPWLAMKFTFIKVHPGTVTANVSFFISVSSIDFPKE